MDVREIPTLVFTELTEDRQPEIHTREIQICNMDHNLWLRLDGHSSTPSLTTLDVISVWGDGVTTEQIAKLPFDLWGTKRLSTLSAGRHETGVYTRDARELRSSINLLLPNVDVAFSDLQSAESIIYGLGLTREIAKRAFTKLHLDNYDTARFMSDELGLE